MYTVDKSQLVVGGAQTPSAGHILLILWLGMTGEIKNHLVVEKTSEPKRKHHHCGIEELTHLKLDQSCSS